MRPRYATEKDWPEVEALLRTSSLCVEGVRERITQYIMVRDNAGLLGCAGVERYGTTGFLRGLAVAQRASFCFPQSWRTSGCKVSRQ